MNRVTLMLTACLYLASCADDTTKQEKNKLQKADWVLGYWQMSSPDGSAVTESWIRTDDTSYSGVGKFTDSTGKVLSTEDIRIVLRNNELWYIPTVSNQNGGQPVAFREADFSDSVIVFENKEHDFPQRIVYQKYTQDSMIAYVEGDIAGEIQRLEFSYKKQ